MRYLITTDYNNPFLTDWFVAENNFDYDVGMNVFDLLLLKYTYDGITWLDIDRDSL